MTESNPQLAYVGPRNDLLKFVSANSKKILDVGCSVGTLGAAIKEKTGGEVIGIEMSKEMASVAAQRIDKVIIGDAEELILDGKIQNYKFDTIIFADLLEHLRDPWSILAKAAECLSSNGKIIASIPNIRHIDTVVNLLWKGYWPYRDRGIHDKTHLRFFTKKNVIELFEDAGLSIEEIASNYRLVEKPHRINRFAKFFAIPGLRDFLVFQYLVLARLADHDIGKSTRSSIA